MEHSSGMYQMTVQQNIAPAPNEGSKVVDWLPKFAGFSWLAYGAHFSVVITMAPSPSNTGEVAMGGFFRQVLSTNWPKEDEEGTQLVSSVAWAPRGLSIGSLAAAAGKHIYLYDPKGLNCAEEGNQDSPELPLRWVKTHVLEHLSDVLSFSWSESGDGLLSVGLEIAMWKKSENGWNCLWRSQLEQPQSLSAASWSARGIAATAEGPSVMQNEASDADHLVKIWWWEDGKELLEVDLAHPHQLLMIQWRPMRSFRSSSQSFRPVLFTCCRDGVVRLWAEIGNLGFPHTGSTSLVNIDTATVTDEVGNAYESQFKLAFFVSAVIDANSTLNGVLGENIHITWPEGTGGGLEISSSDRDESSGVGNKESEVAMNEWLIGIGPSGSITLWSVQSLDDLSPARGPLIQLWQQRSGILPLPSVPLQGSNASSSPQAVRVVVHRPHGTFWGPPSSLDVVEIWSSSLLRWSSIWPPVAAVGGPTSKNIAPNLGAGHMTAASGKMSTWGVSSELVVLSGHHGNIVQIAVHPVAAASLVASLDDQGAILLWDAQGSYSSPRSEITGCLNPLWRYSGQLSGHRVDSTGIFNSMAWAPVVLPRDETLLLLCHSHGVDCTLISRKVCASRSRSKSFSISHTLLYTLDWPMSDDKWGLQGIYTFPSHLNVADSPHLKTCIAVGVGSNGLKLVSWKLEMQLRKNREDRRGSSPDLQESDVREEQNVNDELSNSSEDVGAHDVGKLPASEVQNVLLEVCLLGILKVGTGEKVTSIATATSEHLLDGRSGNLSDFSEVCDIVTGGADGVLRLWNVWDGSSENSVLSLEKARGWHCVGLLRCHGGPVSKVALCSGASKIASFGDEAPEVIYIWGADTFHEERGFCLEERLRLSSAAISFCWLDGGNGLPILGVKSQRDVQLFAECREQALRSGRLSPSLSEGELWTCLASLPAAGFITSTLSWEAQGSLIVTFGAHIILYSNCVLPSASYTPASASLEACQTLTSGGGQTSNSRDILAYEALLAQVDGTYIQSSARLDNDGKSDGADQGPCSVLEAAERIGCPLLDYHPTSLLSWISGGSRQSSRASIRHLASYLLALSSSSNLAVYKIVSKAEQPNRKVSRTPLTELFQGRKQLSSLYGQHPSPIFKREEGGQSEAGRLRGNVSPFSRASFVDFTSSLGYKEEEQNAVIDPNSVLKMGELEPYTKVEVEIISTVVRDSFMIPGLSADEKLQLLAIIDVLSEMDGVGQASQIDGIDLPGQRFWLAFRYSVLYAKWKSDASDTRMVVMESQALAWALQSEFKENLLSLCLLDQSLSWSAMRALGVGYWFTDGTELRKMMEKLARAQYLKKKDPKDCALLYLALDRRSVLAGLFKLSRDQKDRPITDFFSRDFKDEKHKTAALKNAYVLMGKHRHELAASFFILGGDVNSAAVVCAKNLGDPQLALVICSLLEGVNGPIGRDVILKYALPVARDTRDRWLASMLQWLLGEGIKSVEELISDHNRSNMSSQMDKGSLEELKIPPAFPLDPDMGRYCELLASKPRLRNSAHAAEACALAVIATRRSAAAMKRAGLSLQVLEYLQGGRSINFDDAGIEITSGLLSDRTTGEATSPRSDCPLTDVSGRQVGSGWVSREVVAGIWGSTRLSLVLRCASLFLQDHPHWGGQTCSAWQVPVIYRIVSKQLEHVSRLGSSTSQNDEGTILDRSAKQIDLSSYLEAADKAYDDDVQFLKKYSVKVDGVVAALSTFSRIHHRPYLLHRLVNGWWNYMNAPDFGFHLASRAEMSIPVAQFLEGFGTEASRVLAWTVLSCGGAAASQFGNSESLQRKDKETPVKKAITNKGGALPTFSFEELVRFGGEIQLLTKAANHEKSRYGKERGTRALSLLSFIFFVAAAWLGRQTKALFKLIAPTVIDPSTAPEVPQGEFDAVLWFRRLELEERALDRHLYGKKPVEPVGFNMAGTVTIPVDDAWRVLGVCLWNHLLIYVRKQLTGIATEASYSGFGRVSSSQSQNTLKQSIHGVASHPQASVTSNMKGATFWGFNLQASALSSTWLDFKSKVRESYQTVPADDDSAVAERGVSLGKLPVTDGNLSSTPDTEDFDVALLGALTSVVAGLRKQLAAHLEHSLDKSEADPLTLWLWGKLPKPSPTTSAKQPTGGSSLNFFNGSSSNGQVGVSVTRTVNVYSQSQHNLYPTGVIGMEEKECKDLWELLVVREKVCSALGLEGVSGQRRKQENDNMSVWYCGINGQGPTTNSGDIGRGVNTSCRIPPKRIMWNAVKGVSSSVSDQGVILSSRREEQNSQSRSRAPEDGLHLSEEFSEWVDLRGHFRYPIPF